MANYSQEINEPREARVGRFRSRDGQGMTLRRGVKDYVFLRSIVAITHNGDDMKHVCYVECPSNENWLTHNEDRLLPVMRLLEKGRQAVIAEQMETIKAK